MKNIHRALGEILFSREAIHSACWVADKLRDAADLVERYRALQGDQIREMAGPAAASSEAEFAKQMLDALTAAPAPPAPRKRGRKPRAAAANGTAAPESPAPSRPADDPPLPLEV